MCTALRYNNLFGRNFDLDREYAQNIIISPRNYCIRLRGNTELSSHYAIMGMGMIADNFPLYYDAVNERGLAMAGLNFPYFARYGKSDLSRKNVTAFELTPYTLGKCADTEEAVALLRDINITDIPFSEEYPVTPLHWMLADKQRSVVVECTDRLHIYENTADALTNSPSYNIQLLNLTNYMNLTPHMPRNSFSPKTELFPYSFGMGGIGLPGDLSSMSRFVRSVFLLHNSPEIKGEESSAHFFHLLYAVAMTKGAVIPDSGKYEYTQYSCCMELDNMIYRYTSYSSLSEKVYYLFDYDIKSRELMIIN